MHIRASKRLFSFYLNIFLLLFFSMNGFYFIETDSFNIMGINYENMVYVFVLVWIFWQLLRFKNVHTTYKMKWLFIMLIPFCIVGACVSWLRYGGGIITVIKLLKDGADIWLFGLLYFPLTKLVKYNRIAASEFKKCLEFWSIILLILTIVQYFTYPNIHFLNTYTGIRYDQIRFFYQTLLFSIFMCLQLDRLVHGKEKNDTIKATIGIIAVLFEFMIVEKYRNTTACALIVCAVTVFLWKKLSVKNLLGWIVGIVAVLYLLQTTMVQDILKTVFYGDTNIYTNTSTFRSLFRMWVVWEWTADPFSILFGQGIVSGVNGSLDAVTIGIRASGGTYFIPGDHGIFSWLYMFGLMGIIWFAYMLIKCVKTGFSFKHGREWFITPYALMPFMLLLQSLSETPWYSSLGFIIMVIFICLLECEYNEHKKVGGSNDNNYNSLLQ